MKWEVWLSAAGGPWFTLRVKFSHRPYAAEVARVYAETGYDAQVLPMVAAGA